VDQQAGTPGRGEIARQPEAQDHQKERDGEVDGRALGIGDLDRRHQVQGREDSEEADHGGRDVTHVEAAGHHGDGDHDDEHGVRWGRLDHDDSQEQDAERDRRVVAGEREGEDAGCARPGGED
jgi:hypothetical protein